MAPSPSHGEGAAPFAATSSIPGQPCQQPFMDGKPIDGGGKRYDTGENDRVRPAPGRAECRHARFLLVDLETDRTQARVEDLPDDVRHDRDGELPRPARKQTVRPTHIGI